METSERDSDNKTCACRSQLFARLGFGSGVDRLTYAWVKRAKRVTGVDISSAVLKIANSILAGREHITFVLTPGSVVETTAAAAGVKLVYREPDTSAGPDTGGFFYIFGKP